MSFPRYPAYKDSGVEWLGKVPQHWEVRRLKFLCDIQTGNKDTEDAVEDGEYPFFVRSQTVERINSRAFDCEAVLTAGDGAGVGKVFHHYQGPFDFHQRVYMLNNFRGVTGRFVFHFLRENFYKVALEGGAKSTVDSLRRPIFTNFPVAIPPRDEQHSLISFVDTQGGVIDALVAEQERLIELLREKRQAVISHAVTKGLDPSVPMKDSGIEWLGKVPRHWDVSALKELVASIESGTSVNAADWPAPPGSPGVLKTSCVYNGKFEPSENKAVVVEEWNRVSCPVRAGTLIVSRMNTPDLVGAAGRVAIECQQLFLPDRLWQISFRLTEVTFMHYWTLSAGYRAQVEAACTGTSSSMKNLAQAKFTVFTLAVPPRPEQHAIVAFLDAETARIDTLIIEAERAIVLLQERRSALISAAVTGQIDVRGLSPEVTT